MKDIHSQKDTRTLRLITQRRGEHTNKKKKLQPQHIPASRHPLLKWLDSVSESLQVVAAPSAPSLRTSVHTIFIRLK
jgi:hypothetical protein